MVLNFKFSGRHREIQDIYLTLKLKFKTVFHKISLNWNAIPWRTSPKFNPLAIAKYQIRVRTKWWFEQTLITCSWHLNLNHQNFTDLSHHCNYFLTFQISSFVMAKTLSHSSLAFFFCWFTLNLERHNLIAEGAGVFPCVHELKESLFAYRLKLCLISSWLWKESQSFIPHSRKTFPRLSLYPANDMHWTLKDGNSFIWEQIFARLLANHRRFSRKN